MNVVGYLITLANLQSFQESGGPLKDLTIRVGDVQTLENELINQQAFALEGFRQTGYSQVGNVGKYVSQNLRNYIFDKSVEPSSEGVVLTLNYATPIPAAPASISDQEDGTLSYFVHKEGEDLTQEERNNIYGYLDSFKGFNRNKRAALETVN